MAHLASSYSSFDTFLRGADAFWSVDLAAMNNSGVTGTAVLAVNTEDDGTRYLNISIAAEGLTPDVRHAQHVHGTFDDDGNPSDARMPDLGDDADMDGFIEVLEGLGAYGDILLPLVGSDGALPLTDSNGQLTFIQNYRLDDDSNFFSPVSGTDYTAEDLMPLAFREIVLHGQNVSGGFGDGTGGEIDGTQDGFVGILPVAAGEIEMTDRRQALDFLEDQMDIASDSFSFGRRDNELNAGLGDDTISGGGGADRLNGESGDDEVAGGRGNDVLRGSDGDDAVMGNGGNDWLSGGNGDDIVKGGKGDDLAFGNADNDMLRGQGGDDALFGGDGRDDLRGGSGNDFLAGGNGRDSLDGGAGWDEFIYNDLREGRDVISGFEDGMDLINLSGLGLGFEDITVAEARGGSASRIEFGNTKVVLLDVSTGDVDAGDFIF